MTDIGINIFSFNKSSTTSPYTQSGFLIITKFGDSDSADIDKAIFNSNSGNVVVFSPRGNLYITSLDSSGRLTKNFSKKISNPINSNENYVGDYTNWSQIDYTKYSNYNNTIPYPQFFTSLPQDFGNGVIGSGYILYRDSVYKADKANYYLLYNPFDRFLYINTKPGTFSDYCEKIEFQGDSCYCKNDSNNKCLYALAGNQTAGETIQNLDISNANAAALNSYNSMFTNCGCNKICSNWPGMSNLANKPTCASVNTSVICGVNISATDKGKIELGDIKTAQNCSANNSTIAPATTSTSSTNIILPLSIATGVIIVVLIIGIIILRK